MTFQTGLRLGRRFDSQLKTCFPTRNKNLTVSPGLSRLPKTGGAFFANFCCRS